MGRRRIKVESLALYKRYMKDIERYIKEEGEGVRHSPAINGSGMGRNENYLINKWCPCPEYLYRALYEEGFSKLSKHDLYLLEIFFYEIKDTRYIDEFRQNNGYAYSYRRLVSSLSYVPFETVHLLDIEKQVLKFAVDGLVFDINVSGGDCSSVLERVEKIEFMRGRYAKNSIYIIMRCFNRTDVFTFDIETKKSLRYKRVKIKEGKVEDEAEMRIFKRKVLLA